MPSAESIERALKRIDWGLIACRYVWGDLLSQSEKSPVARCDTARTMSEVVSDFMWIAASIDNTQTAKSIKCSLVREVDRLWGAPPRDLETPRRTGRSHAVTVSAFERGRLGALETRARLQTRKDRAAREDRAAPVPVGVKKKAAPTAFTSVSLVSAELDARGQAARELDEGRAFAYECEATAIACARLATLFKKLSDPGAAPTDLDDIVAAESDERMKGDFEKLCAARPTSSDDHLKRHAYMCHITLSGPHARVGIEALRDAAAEFAMLAAQGEQLADVARLTVRNAEADLQDGRRVDRPAASK